MPLQARAFDVGVEKGTFQTYLSIVAGTASSAVTSTGRGRGGGYYLSPAAAKLKAEVQEAPGIPPIDAEPIGEASLYPALQQWLRGQGYQSRVTAPMRALGRWANPDVTGIRVFEHLGRVDVELLTIEAKLSLAQWEYGFFEAVGHRRFANRSYLAFPLPEEAAEKLPDGLRYACELYRVGALVMVLDDKEYEQSQGWSSDCAIDLGRRNDSRGLYRTLCGYPFRISAPFFARPLALLSSTNYSHGAPDLVRPNDRCA